MGDQHLVGRSRRTVVGDGDYRHAGYLLDAVSHGLGHQSRAAERGIRLHEEAHIRVMGEDVEDLQEIVHALTGVVIRDREERKDL